MITSIDIEQRNIKGKITDVYIPKINNIPVLENGYIIKENVVGDKKIDNIKMAQSILDNKVELINNFLKTNSKFL